MERNLTCIVCPKGCSLRIEYEEKNGGIEILEVTGNSCPRGKQYAITECTHPVRTLTTTMARTSGGVVSVRTNAPIPKEKMMACMKLISSVKAPDSVKIGDVLIQNILETGADVVATQNI